MDHFIANFALVFIGLSECLVFAYIFGGERIRTYVNTSSEIRVGRWWTMMLKLIAPAILISLAAASMIELVTEGYGGFPLWALVTGIIIVVLSILAAYIISRLPCQQAQ